MSRIIWTCFISAALLTTGRMLHADDNQPTDSDGYKTITTSSGQTIRVKEQPGNSKTIFGSSSPDKYDPTAYDLNRTSSLASKSFSSETASVSENNSNLKDQTEQTFITKSYSTASSQADSTAPNLNTKVPLATTDAYSHNASGLDKSFTTSSADTAKNKQIMFASTTSSYQGKTANLGEHKVEMPGASPLGTKTYEGPEIEDIKRDLNAVNEGLSRMSTLPNRPLTIDEVRELINHDTKPDTDAKPAPPSKPLNDPEYKRLPSPAPPPVQNDKDDIVPPPGTMAAPENSEPLPQN